MPFIVTGFRASNSVANAWCDIAGTPDSNNPAIAIRESTMRCMLAVPPVVLKGDYPDNSTAAALLLQPIRVSNCSTSFSYKRRDRRSLLRTLKYWNQVE